jgi:hypothetical protein
MSYDLMVFDPQAPPSDREGFMAWYWKQTEWAEGHTYDNPDVTTPALRAWFMDMIKQYPAMNGPFKTDDVDAEKKSDYCIGRSVIYVGFGWSLAESAYHAVFNMAQKHKVGFFDVSADNGGVWVSNKNGDLVCVHGDAGPQPSMPDPPKKKWWKLWKN